MLQNKYAKRFNASNCKNQKTLQHILIDCPEHQQDRQKLKEVYEKFGLTQTVSNMLAFDLDREIMKGNEKFINGIKLEF